MKKISIAGLLLLVFLIFTGCEERGDEYVLEEFKFKTNEIEMSVG